MAKRKGDDMKRNIALVLLVIGIAFLVMGFNEHGTLGSKLGRALGTSTSNKEVGYFIVGGVATALGLFNLLKK